MRGCSGLPRARSPSPPIAPLRAVHAKRRLALLWIRLPPNDFCNLLPTHGHTPEHPILAFRRAPLSRGAPECALVLVMPFWGLTTFPSRRRITRAASREQPFRRQPDGVARTPQDKTPKATARPQRRLQATLRSDHRLRRWPLDDCAGLHGPRNPERRTRPSRRMLPHNDKGEGSPPH